MHGVSRAAAAATRTRGCDKRDPSTAPAGRRQWRRHAWGGVLPACLALLLAGCGPAAPPIATGDAAPPFTAERLDAGPLTFPDDYRGRVVALRFWADWCRFCREEMKGIEPVYARQQASGLAVLAVNVGQSREVAERFVRGLGISYEAAIDPEAEVARLYRVAGLPLTYFVDRRGRVRDKVLGEASAEVFERIATRLLAEPVP
jgi:peroxiredoxin